MPLPRYFMRHCDAPRADEYDSWGTFDMFFEFDVGGRPLRQVERYQNGIVLKYDVRHSSDGYGGLSDPADLSDVREFEISEEEFEAAWILEALNQPAAGRGAG
jgi:hypothetical protein